jgi:ubiquinone/menaquinone biosynthesis C-methylase UbiE
MSRYDLTAKMYDARYAEEQEIKYAEALARLRIGRSSDVVDVGCGTGLLFSHVAAEARMIVGVDVSRKLLLQARERARAFRNVSVIQADADNLPFKNACFSVVLAFTVLQNMPSPLETLRELQRIATAEASIVVTGLKKAFSLEAFRGLLQHAGLHPVSMSDYAFLKCYVAVAVRRS